MKNKGLILIVCLVLLVFGFSSAAAAETETVTTITMKLGAQLEVEDVVTQVLDSAAIRIHAMPEGYGAFAVSLNDVDALKSLFKLEEGGLYVQSDILGQTPLFFSWEDLQAFILEQMEANADMLEANGVLNLDMVRAMLDGSMTEDQLLEMMGIDESFMSFVSDIAASQTTETGLFSVNGSDIANLKTTITVTSDDMVRAVDLPFVRNFILQQTMGINLDYSPDQIISNQMTGTSTGYSQEEIDQEIDTALAEVKQAIEENNLTASITVYTSDDAFVAFVFDISGESDEDAGSISATITKTTIESAEFYQLSAVIIDNGDEFTNQSGSLYTDDDFVSAKYTFYTAPNEPAFTAALNCDMSLPGHLTGDLAFTMYDSYDGGEETAFIVFDQNIADSITDTAIDLFVGGSVDDIKASMAASQLITVNIHTVQQEDSGFFAALQNASPETSVQLLQMTDTELNVYFQGLEESLMITVLTVLDNLPPELSNSLMQQMNGF